MTPMCGLSRERAREALAAWRAATWSSGKDLADIVAYLTDAETDGVIAWKNSPVKNMERLSFMQIVALCAQGETEMGISFGHSTPENRNPQCGGPSKCAVCARGAADLLDQDRNPLHLAGMADVWGAIALLMERVDHIVKDIDGIDDEDIARLHQRIRELEHRNANLQTANNLLMEQKQRAEARAELAQKMFGSR